MTKDIKTILFDHIWDNYGKTLVDDELQEIISICQPHKPYPYTMENEPVLKWVFENSSKEGGVTEVSDSKIKELAFSLYVEPKNKAGEERTRPVGHSMPFGFNKFLKAFRLGFKQGLSHSNSVVTEMSDGWISVKDKLPELIANKDYSNNVFALCDGDILIMTYSYLYGEEGGFFWANCNGDINGDGEIDDDYEVTHWMPLPKNS